MTPSVPGCPIALPYTTLSAWRDRELPAREAQQTQDHIQSCAACRSYLADLDLTGQAVKRYTPPENVQDAIWRDVRATITSQRGAMKKSQKTLALTGIGVAAIIITLFTVVFVSLTNKPATTLRTPTLTPPASASHLVAALQTDDFSSGSLVGYDSATGHVRFTYLGLYGKYMVATQNLIGVFEIKNTPTQQNSSSLQVYNAAGTQVRQIDLGSLNPSLLLAASDTFFVGGFSTADEGTKATIGIITPPFHIRAFVADSGVQRWQQTVSNVTTLDNFVIAGNELVGVAADPTGSQQLMAFNVATGKLDWHVPFDRSPTSTPIATDGATVYGLVQAPPSSQSAIVGQKLVAYDAASGVVRWSHPFPIETASQSQPTVEFEGADQHAVYCGVHHNGTPNNDGSFNAGFFSLVAFSASDGKQLSSWSVSDAEEQFITSTTGQTSIVNGVFYATGIVKRTSNATLPTTKLVQAQLATGTTIWSAPIAGSPMTAPVVVAASIYIGVTTRLPTGAFGNAAIAALSTSGSPLWQTQTPSQYISQLVTLP